MIVNWMKCEEENWCSLLNLNLGNDHFNNLMGVYIIWSNTTIVRVGSGIIKDRIADHRNDPLITKYSELRVTWAKVNANQMEGVEKFLADQLSPTVGERFPNRAAIEVNLPWK